MESRIPTVNSPVAQAVVRESERLARMLEGYQVTSQESYVEAQEKIKEITAKIREIEDVRASITRPIDEARKNAIAFFNKPIEALNAIKQVIAKRTIAWKAEQERKERERQEELDRQAREKERAEKERLRKEAEKKAREAEEARLKALKAKKQGREKTAEKLAEKAQELKTEAKELKTEAREVEIAPKEVKSKIERVEGVAFRTVWKYRIKDPNAIPREYMVPDEKAIGEVARRDKERAVMPGVEFYPEQITQVTADKE